MKKGFFGRKIAKRMAGYKAEDEGKKEEPFIDKKGSASKDKLLMQSILIKGKQIPVKAMKMSSGQKSKEVSLKNTVRRNKTRQS